MRIVLYSVIGLFLLIGVALLVLSVSSRKQPELGLIDGRLRSCPARPNCVCSETGYSGEAVDPLGYSIAHEAAWRTLRQAILATGGVIVREQGPYLHATYQTPVMRFIDDVELRLDQDLHVIHIRSASRVGHSDLGANRRRVARIRKAFDEQVRMRE